MAPVHIDIFADTVCPWCFIGKRRLERALRMRPEVQAEIRWRAFQLNPDMPQDGMDRRRYLELKFGGAGNAARVYDAITEAGESEGIAFDIPGIKRMPNTVDSHRLVRFASARGLQEPVIERLYRAYFMDAKDIGDREVLLEAAAAAGLEREETVAFLSGEAEAEEIRAEDLRARMAGINGVPCFIFNGRFALPGAQPAEVLVEMLDLAREDTTAQAVR